MNKILENFDKIIYLLLFLFIIMVIPLKQRLILISIGIILCAVLIIQNIVKIRIKKSTFILVLVVILFIPVFAISKLLIFGEKTIGEAVIHKKVLVRGGYLRAGFYYYTIFKFNTYDNTEFEMWGAENVIYEKGKKIKIAYDRKDPLNCIILDISNIYSGNRAIVSGVLLLIWVSIYTSFGEQAFRKRKNYPRRVENTTKQN